MLTPALLASEGRAASAAPAEPCSAIRRKNVAIPTRWERMRRSHASLSSSVVGGVRGCGKKVRLEAIAAPLIRIATLPPKVLTAGEWY